MPMISRVPPFSAFNIIGCSMTPLWVAPDLDPGFSHVVALVYHEDGNSTISLTSVPQTQNPRLILIPLEAPDGTGQEP
jgi:hypothetical protein